MVAKVPGNHDIGQALSTSSSSVGPFWVSHEFPNPWALGRFQLPTSWICIVPDGVREPQETRRVAGVAALKQSDFERWRELLRIFLKRCWQWQVWIHFKWIQMVYIIIPRYVILLSTVANCYFWEGFTFRTGIRFETLSYLGCWCSSIHFLQNQVWGDDYFSFWVESLSKNKSRFQDAKKVVSTPREPPTPR